eukprot:scaffold93581_cov45-Phaeocystis_antarctica.AAC.1
MLLALQLPTAAPAPQSSKVRRDVIMMVADDMRPDTACTSVMGTTSGDMHTPNICKLADESLLLTRFHVAFAECAPSRASMLTSRQPHTTRVWNLHSYWRQEGGNFTTLPQYFKEHGYITKGIGKIFHWGPASGKLPLPASGLSAVYCPDNATRSLFRGEFDSDYSWTEEYFAPDGIHDDMDGDAMQPIPEKGPDGTKAKPLADELSVAHAAETLQQIQKARSDGTDSRAFFLAVGWIRPHLPYRFPERFLQYYDADKLELPPTWDKLPVGMPAQAYYKSSETREWKDIVDMDIDYRRYQNGTFLENDLQGLFLGPVKTRQLRQGYYASISYVDWCVGQLLDEAKKVDGYDDAVVVFMSDHGYQLGEFGLWDKETNFAMATNAPFMIRIPGRTTPYGIKSNQLAQGVDVFPTIVAAALGHEVPVCPADSSQVETCTQGVSLLPLTYSPHSPVNVAAFSVHPSYWKPPTDGGEVASYESARSERFDRLEGHEELGSLERDPRSPCLGSKRFQLGDEKKHPTQYLTTCIMGSSMMYLHERHELRYTEWSGFAGPESNWRPNWAEHFAVELYNHSVDPSESRNLADCHGLAPKPCQKMLTTHHPALYKLLRGVLHDQVASLKGRRLLDQGRRQGQQQGQQAQQQAQQEKLEPNKPEPPSSTDRKEKRKEEAAEAKEKAFEEEAKEEAKAKAIADEAKQDAKEQAATRKKEKNQERKAEKRKAAEKEAAQTEEAARAKQEAEEVARRQQQEEEARMKDEEKVAKRMEKEEAEEKQKEEEEAKRKADEEAANLSDEEKVAKRKAEEEAEEALERRDKEEKAKPWKKRKRKEEEAAAKIKKEDEEIAKQTLEGDELEAWKQEQAAAAKKEEKEAEEERMKKAADNRKAHRKKKRHDKMEEEIEKEEKAMEK